MGGQHLLFSTFIAAIFAEVDRGILFEVSAVRQYSGNNQDFKK